MQILGLWCFSSICHGFFFSILYWPKPYCVRLDRGAKQSMEGHNTYVKHCRTAKSTTEVARQSMFCFTLCWLEVVLDLEQNKVIYIQSTIKTQINLVAFRFWAIMALLWFSALRCTSGAPPTRPARPSQIKPLYHDSALQLPPPHSILQNSCKTAVFLVLPQMAPLYFFGSR